MRASPVIATSLGCSALITTALARYIDTYAASAGFWGHDPVGIAWAVSSGMGGFFAVLYAAFAFVLLTTGTLLDLAAARRRLEESAENDRWPEGEWQRAFDGTAFETIAGQFTSYELGIAPLSLLRILRAEIWRVYAKRFTATQTVTILLIVGSTLLDRYIESPLLPPFRVGAPFPTSTLVLLLVVAVMTWLLMDDGISKLAMAVTRLSAGREWPEESVAARALAFGGEERAAPIVTGVAQSIEPLLASINKLISELAGRMTPTEAQTALGTRLETSLKSFESALRDSATQQRAAPIVSGVAQSNEPLLGSINKLVSELAGRMTPTEAQTALATRLETSLNSFESALREGATQQRAAFEHFSALPAPLPAAAPDLAPLEATLKAIETALRESAERQQSAHQAVLDRLAAEPASKEPARRAKETDAEFRKLGEAISLLAMAVDKMAQAEPRPVAAPPAPQIVEPRPPAPPRRRENGESRGDEFAAALRDMNAGMDKRPAAGPAEPPRPAASALTNELQDLLQEMSNYDPATEPSGKAPSS